MAANRYLLHAQVLELHEAQNRDVRLRGHLTAALAAQACDDAVGVLVLRLDKTIRDRAKAIAARETNQRLYPR
jgi:hypothetical protein